MIVLMDQGGAAISCSDDGKTGTLRASEHGHQPIIIAPKVPGLLAAGASGVCIPINTTLAVRKADNAWGGFGVGKDGDPAPTIKADHSPSVCIPLDIRNAIRRPSAEGASGIGEDGTPGYTISATGKVPGVCIPIDMRNATRDPRQGDPGAGIGEEGDKAFAVTAGGTVQGVAYSVYENRHSELRLSDRTNSVVVGGGKPGQGYTAVLKEEPMGDCRVRRLTPKECERLQGFPDDWTKIPYRGKDAEHCPDSPRYKAIGNSWAVPVVRWIGERMDKELKGDE